MTSNPPSEPDARLVTLEERLTFQQRLIEDLNAVIIEHRRELDRLARELSLCRDNVERLQQTGASENLPHEKPPHY